MEKKENSAQKNICFHFFHSIFSKSKYMSHPFSISTYRKSKIAPMRHNCVAGINFSGETAVSKNLVSGPFDGEKIRYTFSAEKQSKSDGGFVNFHSA